jgi:hypothetical protein
MLAMFVGVIDAESRSVTGAPSCGMISGVSKDKTSGMVRLSRLAC